MIKLKTFGVAATISVALAAAPAQADILTFDGLSGAGNGSVFTSYTESGFDVTATGGEIFVGTAFGNPAPSLVVGDVFGGTAFASFDVTLSGGGAFTFDGFDLIGNNGEADYNVEGFLGGLSVFFISGSQGSPFATIGGSAGLIDTLSFSLIESGTSLNVDNINVTAANAAVPEPGTWAMMLLGFGAIGWSFKRRRKLALA